MAAVGPRLPRYQNISLSPGIEDHPPRIDPDQIE